jgi:hypothetical protein
MKYTKKKNGKKIVVKQWSDTVSVFDLKTGELVGSMTFSDHIQAVLAAKAL